MISALAGQGHTVDLLGTRQLFKANAQQTAGAMLCAENSVAPGSGIPAHRHSSEDKAFYVISGQVVIDDASSCVGVQGGVMVG